MAHSMTKGMRMRKRKVGRPHKEPKTKINIRIRTAFLKRYRAFLGPATVLQEAVEQAMKRQMEEGRVQL
jgi:uncharacterized protein (DUF4415 family)